MALVWLKPKHPDNATESFSAPVELEHVQVVFLLQSSHAQKCAVGQKQARQTEQRRGMLRACLAPFLQ